MLVAAHRPPAAVDPDALTLGDRADEVPGIGQLGLRREGRGQRVVVTAGKQALSVQAW